MAVKNVHIVNQNIQKEMVKNLVSKDINVLNVIKTFHQKEDF